MIFKKINFYALPNNFNKANYEYNFNKLTWRFFKKFKALVLKTKAMNKKSISELIRY